MIENYAVGFTVPPAIVVQAFDEQALKREWDEADADEQDAVARKVEVLRKALKQWPMVLSSNPGMRARGKMIHSPEMRRFVRDVLGMPDRKNGMNCYALDLMRNGADGARARSNESVKRHRNSNSLLRRAVVELVTKYRLGADGQQCMAALANFYEEQTRARPQS
jgi:hypothetical protein